MNFGESSIYFEMCQTGDENHVSFVWFLKKFLKNLHFARTQTFESNPTLVKSNRK